MSAFRFGYFTGIACVSVGYSVGSLAPADPLVGVASGAALAATLFAFREIAGNMTKSPKLSRPDQSATTSEFVSLKA
jgi:hypothetical protein